MSQKGYEMNITAFITVRSTSSRLNQKCFLELGDVPVLEHVVRRCLLADIDPIICTTDEYEDDKIVKLAKSLNIKFFRGSKLNKILRWTECCKFYDIKEFHTIDADDPFFCPEEVHRSMSLLSKGFDIVEPTISSSEGGATVGFSITSRAINLVNNSISKNTDTEMVWNFYKNNDIKINITKLPEPEKYVFKPRLTLDYYEDYILIQLVRHILGPNPKRKEIYNLFQRNKDLHLINNFRNDEWKKNQNK